MGPLTSGRLWHRAADGLSQVQVSWAASRESHLACHSSGAWLEMVGLENAQLPFPATPTDGIISVVTDTIWL